MNLDIVVILDRSGSMASVLDDTIGGFNTFIDDQRRLARENGANVNVTLVQFDNQYETVYGRLPIAEVPRLDRTTYSPRGGTALHDAMGRTINSFRDHRHCCDCHCDNKVIFAIMTDGEENSSREYRPPAIKAMIENVPRTWSFVFMGANQDAVLAARAVGIHANSSLNYASNAIGTQHAFKSLSRSAERYAYEGSVTTDFLQDDRDNQTKAGVQP